MRVNGVMSNDAPGDQPVFLFNWYDSLQFKIASLFLVLFLFISLSIFMILKAFGDQIIEEQAYFRLNQANSNVISELERHTVLSTALVQTMANVSENLPNENYLYRTLMPKVINYKGAESYVVGGGIWPAPYQFDENQERHSFFWARNLFKGLIFHDDYNLAQGNGYHGEEWYVPATYLAKDEVYWSKSYIDPYSHEPMVTVSTPLIKNEKNVGVATIDLKLEGLQQHLKKITQPFDGYAFIIDRNGTFLSYPNIEEVTSRQNGTEFFITYQALARKNTTFSPFLDILGNKRESTVKGDKKNNITIDKLAINLSNESHQITPHEAQLIATSILSPTAHEVSNRMNLIIKNDPLLNESAFVAVTEMSGTHWKIVTVMPYSKGVEKISNTYKRLMISTFIGLIITFFIIWLCIRYFITSPITHLAKQVNGNNNNLSFFHTVAKGELRALVDIFNLRNKQLLLSQEKVEKLANFDELTGLPNRRSLIRQLTGGLSSAENEEGYGALLFIDLDDFKRINDSLGHNIGDELLVQLAKRFTHCVTKNMIVARLGGDEFVVLIMKKYTYSRKLMIESSTIAQQLVDAMQTPFWLDGSPHHMTISIGITIFANKNSHANELLRQADTAMYHAKNKGKNCFSLFNTEMQEDAYRHAEIEEALRIALKENKLSLVYQPQVDAEGNCFSVEALARWHHPEKGILSPTEFVKVAEKYGLILELGTWVLDEACAQLKMWSDDKRPIYKMSINVSPAQFQDINFLNIVRTTITKHQLDPKHITLEITEGMLIDNTEDTIHKMNVLNSFGVQLCIDDFGTGYSSLRYLKVLPINALKIDQSFTYDILGQPKNALIVKNIVALANDLQLNLIAGGVEHEKQLTKLIEQGCTQFQGFYFSKPKTDKELHQYLAQPLTPKDSLEE